MMVVAIAVILNTVVSLKTHICIGGQNNSDSNWLEALATRSVLWGIILVQYLLEHDKNGSDVNDHWNRTENWVLTRESDLSVNVFSLRVRALLLSLIRTLRLIPAQRKTILQELCLNKRFQQLFDSISLAQLSWILQMNGSGAAGASNKENYALKKKEEIKTDFMWTCLMRRHFSVLWSVCTICRLTKRVREKLISENEKALV